MKYKCKCTLFQLVQTFNFIQYFLVLPCVYYEQPVLFIFIYKLMKQWLNSCGSLYILFCLYCAIINIECFSFIVWMFAGRVHTLNSPAPSQKIPDTFEYLTKYHTIWIFFVNYSTLVYHKSRQPKNGVWFSSYVACKL